MTHQEKDIIAQALREYVAKYPSQNKAAASLKGISPATLSVILAGDYRSVSDNMFLSLKEQLISGAGRGDGRSWRPEPSRRYRRRFPTPSSSAM